MPTTGSLTAYKPLGLTIIPYKFIFNFSFKMRIKFILRFIHSEMKKYFTLIPAYHEFHSYQNQVPGSSKYVGMDMAILVESTEDYSS